MTESRRANWVRNLYGEWWMYHKELQQTEVCIDEQKGKLNRILIQKFRASYDGVLERSHAETNEATIITTCGLVRVKLKKSKANLKKK